MRIGLSFAAAGNKGGIGRYVRLLAKGLPKYFPEHEYIGYVPAFRDSETRDILSDEGIDAWELITIPAGNRWIFETSGLPGVLRENPPDVFHGPDYLAPTAPCPVCVTIHDLAFQLHPAGMALKSRFLFRTLTPGSVKRAENKGVVFCDSQSTLNALRKIKWLGENSGRVVHLACEDEFREPVDPEEILKFIDSRGIPEKYALYVGPIEQRKNVGMLVEAYMVTMKVLQRRGGPVPPLVAAGPLGAGGSKLKKQLIKASDHNFIYLGYLPRNELRALYAGCTVFCYPSRYEGFGLPPLEAMSFGKAVIVSNATSLPEVTGNAGIQLDPDDVQGWSTALLSCLTNDIYLSELEGKSLEQSRKFSIEKMCREVMDGYQSTIKPNE